MTFRCTVCIAVGYDLLVWAAIFEETLIVSIAWGLEVRGEHKRYLRIIQKTNVFYELLPCEVG